MIYKFDRKTLTYKDITKRWFLLTAGISSFVVVSTLWYAPPKAEEENLVYIEQSEDSTFTPEKLKAYIQDLNVKFPHIVYAQAKLESGNFSSKLFKKNNNLFGMKQAKSRPTTNKGSGAGYAYYTSWQESVLDYALYSATCLSKIKSESQYYAYLGEHYAEDSTYVAKLKQTIKKEKIE